MRTLAVLVVLLLATCIACPRAAAAPLVVFDGKVPGKAKTWQKEPSAIAKIGDGAATIRLQAKAKEWAGCGINWAGYDKAAAVAPKDFTTVTLRVHTTAAGAAKGVQVQLIDTEKGKSKLLFLDKYVGDKAIGKDAVDIAIPMADFTTGAEFKADKVWELLVFVWSATADQEATLSVERITLEPVAPAAPAAKP